MLLANLTPKRPLVHQGVLPPEKLRQNTQRAVLALRHRQVARVEPHTESAMEKTLRRFTMRRSHKPQPSELYPQYAALFRRIDSDNSGELSLDPNPAS